MLTIQRRDSILELQQKSDRKQYLPQNNCRPGKSRSIDMTLRDAVCALEDLAAGRQPDRERLLLATRSLQRLCNTLDVDRDWLDACAWLEAFVNGRSPEQDTQARARLASLAVKIKRVHDKY